MSAHTGEGERSAYEEASRFLHAIWHCKGCQARNRLTRELIRECHDGAEGLFKRDDGRWFVIRVTVGSEGKPAQSIKHWDDPEL